MRPCNEQGEECDDEKDEEEANATVGVEEDFDVKKIDHEHDKTGEEQHNVRWEIKVIEDEVARFCRRENGETLFECF